MTENIYQPAVPQGDPSKPEGEAGKQMLKRINHSHQALRDWGFPYIDWQPGMRILDIGCGGGAAIREMLDLSAGSVVSGIDYQQTSVDTTSETNREFLGTRVDVRQGDAGDLPYDDGTFDLITAVETVYFWPDLPAALTEMRRVLKPGGMAVILNDACDPDGVDWPETEVKLTIYRPEELTGFLADAGFRDITVTIGDDGQKIVVKGTR